MYSVQGIFQHYFQYKKVRTILDKIPYTFSPKVIKLEPLTEEGATTGTAEAPKNAPANRTVETAPEDPEPEVTLVDEIKAGNDESFGGGVLDPKLFQCKQCPLSSSKYYRLVSEL